MADESPARITRVRLKNYKSIVSCDVELRPLTILVGPNGSGKSNFLDALRFVSEALTVGLEQAIRNRGNVRRILSELRSPGEATFSIDVYFKLPQMQAGRYLERLEATSDAYTKLRPAAGRYLLEIEATEDADFRVRKEELFLDGWSPDHAHFSADENGLVTLWWTPADDDLNEARARAEMKMVPAWTADRLYLVNYSGMPYARPVYDLLTLMTFYNPSPASMRSPREHEPRARLLPDGANVASVLRRISEADHETMWRINRHLSRILPGLVEIAGQDLGGFDSIVLRQQIAGGNGLGEFRAGQISDGTLRALAILVALFQSRMDGKSQASLIGIEEPETGLHPAAADVLLNALMDASATTQVLVTTHSADLLQSSDLDVNSLLAVVAREGITDVGPLDDVGRSVLRDRLFTAGELLRMKQLRPATRARESSGDAAASRPASR